MRDISRVNKKRTLPESVATPSAKLRFNKDTTTRHELRHRIPDLASIYATRVGAQATKGGPCRRRVPRYRGRSQDHRRDFVLVGHYAWASPPAYRRGDTGAGGFTRSDHLRRVHTRA